MDAQPVVVLTRDILSSVKMIEAALDESDLALAFKVLINAENELASIRQALETGSASQHNAA